MKSNQECRLSRVFRSSWTSEVNFIYVNLQSITTHSALQSVQHTTLFILNLKKEKTSNDKRQQEKPQDDSPNWVR